MFSRTRLSEWVPEEVIRPYLFALSVLFAASILAGFLSPAVFREQVVKDVQKLMGPVQNYSGGQLFLLILLNNVTETLFILLFGVFFGILPVVSVGANGFFLGMVCMQEAGTVGYWKAALEVLPHGMFEIPAFLLAASYGMWLGVSFLQRIRRKESNPLKEKVRHAMGKYFTIAFPLFVIAAAIETALMVM